MSGPGNSDRLSRLLRPTWGRSQLPKSQRHFRWVGSAIETANRAEIMFDVLMTVSIVLPFGFPAVPWFFGARWGRTGIWLSTGFSVVILLCFFPILFWVACGDCGQGAIALFFLVPIWIVSALFTVTFAAFAHYKFARKFLQDREGAGG